MDFNWKKVYEENLTIGRPAAHAYDRLIVIYRSIGDKDNEERVIRLAIDKFPNITKYQNMLAKITSSPVHMKSEPTHHLANVKPFKFTFPEGYQILKRLPEDPEELVCYGAQTSQAMCFIKVLPCVRDYPLDSVNDIINDIHHSLTDEQGLIHVESGKTKSGHDLVYSIIKMRKQPSGVIYYMCMQIKAGSDVIAIEFNSEEIGITGGRDATVFEYAIRNGLVSFDNGMQKGWTQDPYDSSYQKGLLMNLSEQPQFDEVFPEHPLSVMRFFIKQIIDLN